uniref:Uncharacterized protein n=1 Tax=Utricularia reniformis TaxID=192314 RepID=A0A1Y0AZ16_9LAMI|nr:hypothetical protein AEK19_MT1661 [Utricularia reniformis]ART30395.1 hypothetical protein AEK19_MT1661 [Utricularia reniformis]
MCPNLSSKTHLRYTQQLKNLLSIRSVSTECPPMLSTRSIASRRGRMILSFLYQVINLP